MKYRRVVKLNPANERDWKLLVKVSNELLDAAYAPADNESEIQLRMNQLPDIILDRRSLARKRIIATLDAGGRSAADRKAAVKAAVKIAGDDPELLRLAATYVRSQGEQKHRSRDYSHHRRAWLDDLWREINLLSRLWKLNQIKVTSPRDAIRMVILRTTEFDIVEDELPAWVSPLKRQLIAYEGNRVRDSARR